MRFVDRTRHAPPGALTEPGRRGQLELEAARASFLPGAPANAKRPDFAAYKDEEVKLRLEAMFHGKCAYCETRYAQAAPMDVEHYRPKGRVAEDEAHSGYWWLAMAWDNLLSSCIDCNRQRSQVLVTADTSLEALSFNARPGTTLAGKKDSFPLAEGGVRAQAEADAVDAERALLINPCRDRPQEHLAFSFEEGLPLGLAIPVGNDEQRLRGAVSIQVYGLNRLQLVQDRTRVLRNLAFLGELVVDLSQSIEELDSTKPPDARTVAAMKRTVSRLRLLRDRVLSEMKALGGDDAPYSAMVRAWLEEFRSRLRN